MGQSLDIPRVIPNDWKRLDLIVNKIKMRLGRDSNPTFAGLTISGKLDAGSFSSPVDVTATRQYGFELHYSGNNYDVTGIRSRAQLVTTDTTASAQGALLQAANNDGIDAGVLQGALIEAIGKSTANAATITNMRGALVGTEWGALDTVTNLKTLHVRGHSLNAAGAGSFGTGYGIYIENEAVGGNGQAYDAGIYFKGTNLSAGNKAFTYGIDFSGGTFASEEIKLANSSVIGSDKVTLAPTTDSTTFFQVLDAAGAVIGNVDTTNKRWGLGTAIPYEKFDISYGNMRFSREVSPGIPTVAINAAAGNLNGIYYYRITYVTSDGETTPGVYSAAVNPINQQVDLTNISVGSAKVIARRIYRTTANPSSVYQVMKYVDVISDNTTTTYTDNIADGSLGVYNPGINTTGGNFYVNSNLTGIFGDDKDLIAIGYLAGVVNKGYFNTAYGNKVLTDNTIGSFNTGAGNHSLYRNTEGNRNTAYGHDSMALNTTGSYSIGIGSWSLYKSNSSYSIGIGGNSLYNHESGDFCLGIGHMALRDNIIGEGCIALGSFAGMYETGSDAFYVNNRDQTDTVGDKANSLLYGVFAAAIANQSLRVNGALTVGYSSFAAPFTILSTDTTDQISIYHDNSQGWIKWSDGRFTLQTDEGDNTNTIVEIAGKGTGRGFLWIRDASALEYIQLENNSGYSYISGVGAAPVELAFQNTADIPITMFRSAASAETQALRIFGFRSGDEKRSLRISVGIDAADTVSFYGLSNYLFDGNLILPKTSGVGIKVDTVTPTFGWRDLKGKITNSKGATKPSEITYREGITQFQFGAGDDAGLEYHIPHDYVPGTDIHLHVHWSHISGDVTGGNVIFTYEITYCKGHNQAAFPATVTGTITGTASATQYQHVISEGQISAATPEAGVQIDTDDLEPDGLILCRIEMTTNNMTGAIPSPFIHEVDVHYQSTNLGTKQKAPNFYA